MNALAGFSTGLGFGASSDALTSEGAAELLLILFPCVLATPLVIVPEVLAAPTTMVNDPSGPENVKESSLNSFFDIEVGLLLAIPDDMIVDRIASIFFGSFSEVSCEART